MKFFALYWNENTFGGKEKKWEEEKKKITFTAKKILNQSEIVFDEELVEAFFLLNCNFSTYL